MSSTELNAAEFSAAEFNDDLYIAIGNPLRRDDGVAAKVIEALRPAASRIVMQPTFELAADIASARRVIFVDAAVEGKLRLDPVNGKYGNHGSHGMEAGEVVALSRELYGFSGEAWFCRVPGEDFGVGEGLHPRTQTNAAQAVELLRNLHFPHRADGVVAGDHQPIINLPG